jgi:hypothetical protein
MIQNDSDIRQALVELTLDYNAITIKEDGTIKIHWKS